MTHSEIKDYWRWKMVRQISDYINNPDERNNAVLKNMIDTYPSINSEMKETSKVFSVQPAPADFVCTLDL